VYSLLDIVWEGYAIGLGKDRPGRKASNGITELGRMSSRALQDLGINRADIQSVARQSVAR
jgi:hypothetical protein